LKLRVCKEYTFSAAHFLPDHPTCGTLHGHNYKVRVKFAVPTKPEITVDFYDIDKIVLPIISKFDHSNLNDFFGNPTAEQLCIYIYEEIKQVVPNLVSVRVYETDKCFVDATR